jgi:hypothetical protein
MATGGATRYQRRSSRCQSSSVSAWLRSTSIGGLSALTAGRPSTRTSMMMASLLAIFPGRS